MKKIAIGGDHAGFEFKHQIIEHLTAHGFDVKDFGTYSSDSTDYPDYAHPVSLAVKKGEFDDIEGPKYRMLNDDDEEKTGDDDD